MAHTLTIIELAAQITADTTRAKRRRVMSALTDTCRFIEKEERCSADLRPAHVAKLLEDYKTHAAYLSAALDAAA